MRKPHARVARLALLVVLVGAALTACSSSSNDDTAGTAVKATDAVGTWAETGAKPPVNLKLTEDGKVSGTDGCNQMNGTWKISGSSIEFGPFSATMMACADVDTWLSGASSATVSGDEMTIKDDGGKDIGTLTKQS